MQHKVLKFFNYFENNFYGIELLGVTIDIYFIKIEANRKLIPKKQINEFLNQFLKNSGFSTPLIKHKKRGPNNKAPKI
jgi:hypothetical protein